VRQRCQADGLISGCGRIVAEYFDVGQSRVLPWARRPLSAAMADPHHAFGAIVLGEYERPSTAASTATPTPPTKPRSTPSSACGSPTSPRTEQSAPKHGSARSAVGYLAVSEGERPISQCVLSGEFALGIPS